ncbi:MAG: endo-1,4-beta-xylanase [Treponema sp.]|jgi:endo-1,4-beta-xylanase|nr:endo-1,4-beta-xylanase [Treponema sp.]
MLKKIILCLLTPLLMGGCVSGKEAAMQKIQSLKDAYADYFLIGNIVSGVDMDDLRYNILTTHHNIATAENAMKPQYLQGTKGVFTFYDADAIVNKALSRGLNVHGHTLAWHQQSPAWMNYEGVSREEAVINLTTHAKTVAAHFKGRVVSWDVLNEAIADNPSNTEDWKANLRQSPWFKAVGADYVEIVFKAAREADPDAKLYYNDYNLDNPNKASVVYNMVKDINERNPDVVGRPLIDGVGMQGHYSSHTSPANVENSLQRFISLGVEVSITELDVQCGEEGKQTDAQKVAQGITYAALFNVFKKYAENIGRVTMWGLDDGSSWRRQACPTMFNDNLHPKPAFFAALDPDKFITENGASIEKKEAKQAEAVYGTPDLADAAAWSQAPAISIDSYLMAWQGASGTAKVLWDESNLYVLVNVNNAEMNKANQNTYEQDSVEIFIDENNGKTPYYEKDDAQYRVNFDNEATFNPQSAAEGFESRTTVSGRSYTVSLKIPFRTIDVKRGGIIGFDVQINGASSRGARQSVAVWNDLSGGSYQDTSGLGILKLTKR